MDSELALAAMRDAVALWYVDRGSAADIVRAACDLLVAGSDGLSLCLLAGVSFRDADARVPALLEAALRDVGLSYRMVGTAAADEAGVRAMAARVVAGVLAPRDMATWVLTTFDGHRATALTVPFKRLGFAYEFLDSHSTVDRLDDEVLAVCRALVAGGPYGSCQPGGWSGRLG